MIVTDLLLHPVASLAGLAVPSGVLTAQGLDGDRRWCVRDAATGEKTWAGAWPALLGVRTLRAADGAVTVQVPGSAPLAPGDPELDAALSAQAGHDLQVALSALAPLEDAQGTGEVPGARDAGPDDAVHLLTTGSLRAVRAALPAAELPISRFRPTVVVATEGDAPREFDWVGRRLLLGEVELEISRRCPRCVMTTLATHDAPADRSVLRWINRAQAGDFGVYARVVRPGTLRPGDPVAVSPAALAPAGSDPASSAPTTSDPAI